MKNWVKAVISVAIPQIAALSGAYFTVTGSGSWYQTINKPHWNPPGWVFGPVWTTLYILMGIAFFLIWKSGASVQRKRAAMVAWGIQLALNFLWTVLFFNQHMIGGALVEIILLWFAILATILLFARIHKVAAWLLVPYISWVSFATLLTCTIWTLNN